HARRRTQRKTPRPRCRSRGRRFLRRRRHPHLPRTSGKRPRQQVWQRARPLPPAQLPRRPRHLPSLRQPARRRALRRPPRHPSPTSAPAADVGQATPPAGLATRPSAPASAAATTSAPPAAVPPASPPSRPAAASPPPAAGTAAMSSTAPPELPKRSLAPVLDAEVLDDLQSMLGDEVDRLVDVFLEDTPRLIKALEQAAGGPDYDALRDAAHSL